MLEELQNACRPGMIGGFLPGVKQIANVAALPGIVHKSIGLPDIHSGYGFAIGLEFLQYFRPTIVTNDIFRTFYAMRTICFFSVLVKCFERGNGTCSNRIRFQIIINVRIF